LKGLKKCFSAVSDLTLENYESKRDKDLNFQELQQGQKFRFMGISNMQSNLA